MSEPEAGYVLTYGQAVALLPDDERIHTFMNPAGMLIGADWDREDVLALLRDGQPELSGDQATAMGHGIVAFRGGDRGEPMFVATKTEELTADDPA